MFRHFVALPPIAKACKAAALLLVLSGILGLFVHSIVSEHRAGEVAGGAKLEAR